MLLCCFGELVTVDVVVCNASDPAIALSLKNEEKDRPVAEHKLDESEILTNNIL